MENFFGKPIFTYTRKQAIEDGYQFKLPLELEQLAKEAGYKYPVYMTSGLFGIVENAVNDPKNYNDLKGVMWDIFWMSRANAKPLNESSVEFKVSINRLTYTVWVECGPVDIDDPAPCLTFMLPEER